MQSQLVWQLEFDLHELLLIDDMGHLADGGLTELLEPLLIRSGRPAPVLVHLLELGCAEVLGLVIAERLLERAFTGDVLAKNVMGNHRGPAY